MNKKIFFIALTTAMMSAFSMADPPPAPPPAPAPDGTEKEIVNQAKEKVQEKKSLGLVDTNIVTDTQNNELTPDEIRQIKADWEAMRRQQETPSGSQPKPVISMQTLDLSPGVTPPVVRVSDETGVILDFIDARGRAWAINNVVNMSSNQIDVGGSLDPKNPQSSVFVKSKRFGAIGNVAIFLKNLQTPIIITLLSGQKDVDYRVDFRVPAYLDGDNKKNGGGNEYIKSYFDNRMASATMGITPPGCQRKIVENKQTMVWMCDPGNQDDPKNDSQDKIMIVRVDGLLLSPAPVDGMEETSIDGTHVYEIPPSPVLSISVDGSITFVDVKIEE